MSVGTQVASLYGVLSLQDDMTPALNDAKGKIGEFDDTMTTSGRKAAIWGKALAGAAISIGVAAAPVVIWAVKTAASWEESFSRVSAVFSGTDEELAAFEKGLRGLATADVTGTLKNAHEQLAGIAEVLAGYDLPTKNLIAFTEAAALLQIDTDMKGTDAAALLASFTEVSKMNPDNVQKLASSLVWLGNNMGGNEKAVMDMATAISAAGKAAGLHEADILGFSSAILRLDPGATGANVNKFLGDFTRIIGENGPALQQMADIAGIEPKFFTSDPSKGLIEFISGLSEMDVSAQVQALEDMGLKGEPVQRMLMALAGNQELFNKALLGSDAAWQAGTAAMDEATKKTDTTVAQWQLFKSRMGDLGISLGNAILPLLNDALGWINGLEISAGLEAWAGVFENAKVIGQYLLDSIGAGIGDVGTWVNDSIITPISDAIMGALDSSWAAANALGTAILDGILSALSGLGTSIVDLINMAIPDKIDLGPLGSVKIGNLPGGSGGGATGQGQSTWYAQATAAAAAMGAGLTPLGGGRALGGPVSAGIAYEWQEHGREYFIPGVSGYVMPESKMGGGGTTIIQVMMPNGSVLFETMVDEARRRNVSVMGGATP